MLLFCLGYLHQQSNVTVKPHLYYFQLVIPLAFYVRSGISDRFYSFTFFQSGNLLMIRLFLYFLDILFQTAKIHTSNSSLIHYNIEITPGGSSQDSVMLALWILEPGSIRCHFLLKMTSSFYPLSPNTSSQKTAKQLGLQCCSL